MLNPVIRDRNKRIVYLLTWATIIVVHFLFIHFYYGLPGAAALVDSLVYNIFFLFIGIGIWYIVRYNDFEVKKIPNLISGHILSAIILLTLWMTMARFLVNVFGFENEMAKFSNVMIPLKIVTGVFYYIVITLIYYLLIYYENFREKIQKEANREVKYREAELHALKSQINPHFIFNSLNSVSSLTLSDPESAQEMIVKLSEFLRLTLKDNQGQFIALQDELEFTSLYIEIEKIRFGDKLKFDTLISKTSRKVKVPHMILQPLVENAIKHGVMESINPINIVIESQIEDSYLIINIKNEFDPEYRVKGEGVGLQNVRERLKLLYGMTDLIETLIQNNIFKVSVRIPVSDKNQ